MNEQIITSLTIDEFKTVISNSISTELQKFRPQEPTKQDDQLIKLNEVAELLHVSKVTIFAWKKAGKIPFYRISNKVYFKKQEVIDALNKVQRRSI